MSCDWHWFCADCNENGPLEVDHGAKDLKALWEGRERIVAAAAMANGLPGDLELRIERYGDTFPAWWIVQHKDHQVRVKNEYGQFFGDCAKHFACECCGTEVSCNLSEGHDGGCRRVKQGERPPGRWIVCPPGEDVALLGGRALSVPTEAVLAATLEPHDGDLVRTDDADLLWRFSAAATQPPKAGLVVVPRS